MLCKPLVKWVGGKSQLLKHIQNYYPFDENIYKYAEPFVGGGAVLFDILNKYQLKEIYISDINQNLINLYKTVKENPDALIVILKHLEEKYHPMSPEDRKAFFYSKRKLFNHGSLSDVEKAALFIFLNKTCFNGLYRENQSGEFNTPHGLYLKPAICEEENIRHTSLKLQNVIIKCENYENCFDFVDEHTFVYMDPPYRPISKTSSFTAYTKHKFDDQEQIKLAEFTKSLNEKGAKFLLSNSDPQNINEKDDFFQRLYDFCEINKVEASRNINCQGNKRKKVSELLIFN